MHSDDYLLSMAYLMRSTHPFFHYRMANAQAGLIVVYANRGTTTRLVAKYRPPMPVVALVVPTLVQRDHKWTLRGLAAARQTLIVRGA